MVAEAAIIASATSTSMADTAFSARAPAPYPAPAMGVIREVPRMPTAVLVAQLAKVPKIRSQ